MKNWKNDDELLNLAFGELTESDSQALEARLLGDSSAQTELDLLRTLRSDLTAIRDDIPEMQFSKERLRQAIESSGAKPVRSGINWLNFLLGPAAVASVAALAFVMTKGASHREPVIVASGSKPAVEKLLPDVQIKAPAGLSTERVATNTKIEPGSANVGLDYPDARRAAVVNASSKSKPRTKSSKRRFGQSIGTAGLVATRSDSSRSAKALVSEGARPNKPEAADTMPMALAAAAPPATFAATTESAPIILIDATTDSGVGAPTAREVSNPTNVAIGG